MKIKTISASILIIMVFFILLFADTPKFGAREDKGTVDITLINEASGIAASRKNPGVLWTHNDSGDKNRVFAINSNAKLLGIYYLKGVTNRDWEDIAAGPGPDSSKDYIYVGEIGDNNAVNDTKYIYRFAEPTVDSTQTEVIDTIQNVDKISFVYPDGKRDAETLMIDPDTKDIYVVSKWEDSVRIYRAAYPQTTDSVITLEKIGLLNFTYVTAGDISPDGNEIIIKNYAKILYWKRNNGETLSQVFTQVPDTLPYTPEPQGEGLCWDREGRGYYTISEKFLSDAVHLYYYPRVNATGIKEKKTLNEFTLFQNYPNPFNPTTTIKYSIPSNVVTAKFAVTTNRMVTLKIYDILGKEVVTLVNKSEPPGNYEVKFNGSKLPSGIYLYQIKIGNLTATKKLILLK